MPKIEIKKGLEGVYVAESGLGFIDGKKGILRYRGYDAHDLADHASYEEVVYLLWFGELPNRKGLRAFDRKLIKERALPRTIIRWIKSFPKTAYPMDVLRTVSSALALYDKSVNDVSRDEIIKKAIRLTAAFPTIAAVFERVRQGKKIVQPNSELGHAANFLYMLRGKKANKLEEKVMDVCFVLHAEHELNASAFSARVTVSTLSDVYAAITSAIGTLKGPLHGGANEKVLKMLKEIKQPEKVERYVLNKLKKHEKIMGFGHRVYKTKDPRAYILERFSEQLGQEKGDLRWFLISKEIERMVEPKLAAKKIFANVDFYSASTYHYLGIAPHLFPTIFACSRIAGWIGHVIEQYGDNKLIRPLSVYNGPEKRKFVPLERRK